MLDVRKVFLGIAPIGWCNDDMPELGGQCTFEQIVSEMALAGFAGCEIGNKFPSDPAALQAALDLRSLRVASRWFSSFLLTEPYEAVASAFGRALDFLAAVGADRINVSEQSHSIQGLPAPVLGNGRHIMDEAEWGHLIGGLNRLGAVAAGRGFKLCFHHHMGTVVQTGAETRRLLRDTDPETVFLCYDTGHFALAGDDPAGELRAMVDRVGHVHLKDVRGDVAARVAPGGWSFLEAVKNGVFTVPGDGTLDFDPIFALLSEGGYEGWLLVEAEQDPALANPLEYAMKARAYIRLHAGL